jgi:hypothetical protein
VAINQASEAPEHCAVTRARPIIEKQISIDLPVSSFSDRNATVQAGISFGSRLEETQRLLPELVQGKKRWRT